MQSQRAQHLTRMHTRGIFFRRLRSKPSLTEQDNQDRLAFAAEFGLKESAWWCQIIHMHVKHFPVSLHGDARLSAAREGVRGAYGTAGEGLDGEHAKRNPKLRYNTGAKGVGVLAGVGDGRVLLWQYIDANWRGEVAAQMYAGPVLNTLRKEYPGKRKFTFPEENDPAGFKRRKAMEANAFLDQGCWEYAPALRVGGEG